MSVRDEHEIERESVERFDPDLAEGKIIAAEHQARYRWAASAGSGKEVLDAGSGVGYGSAMLAEGGASRVIGVEKDSDAVAQSISRYRGGPVEFVTGDLRETPFEDEAFDLVVCFEVIEHIEQQGAVLDELRRVLRRDGHLLVSSPNRDVFPPGNPHHVREYVPEELREDLSKRFAVVELWRQHTWLGSAVLDAETAEAGPERDIETTVTKLAPLHGGEELYTLAVAGETPLSGMLGSTVLCEPIEIRDLIVTNYRLNEQLRERGEELVRAVEGFETSLSWRVTGPLRSAKRLRARLRGQKQP